MNAIPDSFFESHPTFSAIIDRLRPMIVSSDTSQDLGDRIYKQAISLLGQQTLSDSLYSHDTESPPETLSPEESVSEMINDVTEEEPFASARSSFSSDADVGVLPEEPAKVPAQMPATREVGFPPVLHPLMTDRVCYIEFSKRKEESSATHSSVVFHFAVVREERFTYIGWFSSLSPISGYGFSFNSDGSYYMGEFRKGKKNGFGQFFYDNGSHYDGYWENNQKQGSGRFYFNDNLFYSGRWNENRMIDCKLEYSPGLCSDISCICNFLSTHNDYIFFKQAQLGRDSTRLRTSAQRHRHEHALQPAEHLQSLYVLQQVLQPHRGDERHRDRRGHRRPERTTLEAPRAAPLVPLSQIRLTGQWGWRRCLRADLAIQTLEVADHSLNNLLIFYIISMFVLSVPRRLSAAPDHQDWQRLSAQRRHAAHLRPPETDHALHRRRLLQRLREPAFASLLCSESQSTTVSRTTRSSTVATRTSRSSSTVSASLASLLALASLFSIHFGRNCCTSIYSFYLNALPTLSVLYFGSRAFRSTQIFTLTSGAFAS